LLQGNLQFIIRIKIENMKIIENALARGAGNLNEHDSKRFLATYGIPITGEAIARNEEEVAAKASEIGYPVVLKGSDEAFRHKTELNLIALNLKDEKSVRRAYHQLARRSKTKLKEVLVQEMIEGQRELMVGLYRDHQFGPCVMFGLGGIFTEILEDIVFRVAPLKRKDAMEMLTEIKGKRILESFRGKPRIDRDEMANILMALSQIGKEQPKIGEIDINPVKLVDGKPVAVDALVVFSADPL
jgi:succinyl-CoA synthetase beta subunit